MIGAHQSWSAVVGSVDSQRARRDRSWEPFAPRTRHRPSPPLATPRTGDEGRSDRRQALSLFLFPENVVPVILVGFGYRLLTFAHTLLLRRGVWLAFSLGRGFRFGFDNLAFGNWLLRRRVFGFI